MHKQILSILIVTFVFAFFCAETIHAAATAKQLFGIEITDAELEGGFLVPKSNPSDIANNYMKCTVHALGYLGEGGVQCGSDDAPVIEKTWQVETAGFLAAYASCAVPEGTFRFVVLAPRRRPSGLPGMYDPTDWNLYNRQAVMEMMHDTLQTALVEGLPVNFNNVVVKPSCIVAYGVELIRPLPSATGTGDE